MEDHETRRKIIRQWRALPKDKRQTADQAAAFAKRAVEQNKFQRSSCEPYDRISRPIQLERFSPLARSVDFERYDFRVGGLSGRTVEIVSVQIGLARP